ncbi:hypothetical protein D3C80_1668310 [compost metagenome]
MWALYEDGKLQPDTPLTGHFDDPEDEADVDSVLREIAEALREQQRREAARAEADNPQQSAEPPTPPWMQA